MMMRKVYRINGLRMDTREHAHAHIKHRMRFPDYYGNNLDALCDCLSEISEPSVILIRYCGKLRESLGEYGDKMLSAFAAMTGENPMLRLVIHERF